MLCFVYVDVDSVEHKIVNFEVADNVPKKNFIVNTFKTVLNIYC